MSKFKVGDRVRVRHDVPAWAGMTGTVMGYDNNWMRFSPDKNARYNNGDMVSDQYRQSPYAGMHENDFELVASAPSSSPLAHQEGGSHYKDMAIQPVEYIMANGLDFCAGAVVKYVSRYKVKNGIEDLRKARHFIDMMIEREEKAQANG